MLNNWSITLYIVALLQLLILQETFANIDVELSRRNQYVPRIRRRLAVKLSDYEVKDASFFETFGSTKEYSYTKELLAHKTKSPKAIEATSPKAQAEECAQHCFENKDCQWFFLEIKTVKGQTTHVCNLWADVDIKNKPTPSSGEEGVFGYLKTTNSHHLNRVANCDTSFTIDGLTGSPHFCRSKADKISYYYEPNPKSLNAEVCARVPLTLYRAFHNDYLTKGMKDSLNHADSTRRLVKSVTLPIRHAKLMSPDKFTRSTFEELISSPSGKEYKVKAGGDTVWEYRFDKNGRVVTVDGVMTSATTRPTEKPTSRLLAPKTTANIPPKKEEKKDKGKKKADEGNDDKKEKKDKEKKKADEGEDNKKVKKEKKAKKEVRLEEAYQSQLNKIHKDARVIYKPGVADAAGHIVGYQFDCPNGFWNFVVQAPQSNSGGCWHQSELWIERILDFECQGKATMGMEYIDDVFDYSKKISAIYDKKKTKLFQSKALIDKYSKLVSEMGGKECGLFYRPVVMNLQIVLDKPEDGSHCAKAWKGMKTSQAAKEYFTIKNDAVTINRAMASWSDGPDKDDKELTFSYLLGYATTVSGHCYNEMGNSVEDIQITNDFDDVYLQVGRTSECLATTTSSSTLTLVDCDTKKAGRFSAGVDGKFAGDLEFEYTKSTVGPKIKGANKRDDYLSGCLCKGAKCAVVKKGAVSLTATKTTCTKFRTTYDPTTESKAASSSKK